MRILAVLTLLLVALAAAQDSPRPLTHDDYDAWQSIRGTTLSRDGAFVAFGVRPQVGDGVLHVRATDGDAHHVIERGTRARFTADGRFLICEVSPPHDDVIAYELFELAKKSKKGKKKSGKKDETKLTKPVAGLAILDLKDGSIRTAERVKSFAVPEEGPAFVAWLHEKPEKKDKKKKDGDEGEEKKSGEEGEETEKPAEEKKTEEEKKPEEPAGQKSEPEEGEEKEVEEKKKDEDKKERKWLRDGLEMVVLDLASGNEIRRKGVVDYGITSKKGLLWWSASSKKDDEAIDRGLFAQVLGDDAVTTLVTGGASFKSLRTDRDVTRMAFLSDRRDREAEKPTFDLYAWDLVSDAAERIVSHVDSVALPGGHVVSPDAAPRFSRDGSALLFGACEAPEEDPDPILDREKVTVDIWNWRDPLLQTMQRVRAGRTRTRSLACVWHFDGARMVVASSSLDESVRFLTSDGSRLLATTSESYGPEVSWDGRYSDVYVVNAIDGSRRQVLTRIRGFASPSPEGRHLAWFADGVWYAADLVEGTTRALTDELAVSFEREDWDTPQPARAYGIAGWTEDGRDVLIYDRFDVWRIRLDGSRATMLTDGLGRANNIRFRWQRFDADDEERFFPADGSVLLTAFDEDTMASGFYTDAATGLAKPKALVMRDASHGRATKAADADRVVYSIQTFVEPPNLWTSELDFAEARQLSDLNPQQEDVRWGKAELVHWRSSHGEPLKGIVIKPDGFDPSKQYPLMVYFYEKRSQSLHRYRTPSPGTSPNPSYYVSNGYVWFIPDISYREGYPGESCLACVVPGVQKLLDQGYIDPGAIGAAGHSWGGYQTAYLVTRTNIFAAVESGAPVSNMTSAYGGIRWGSGMSRAFQYERTQSRIGGSLWEYPMRYLENSPLFTADKVETPVLMLHNDEDGAVPWYQGIEFFCALRRLGKEVYMLNYNGAGHGLRKRANTMDWTMRMQQYFDHHLKGAPAPAWMTEGVPYVDRMDEKRSFRPPRHRIPEEPEAPATEEPAPTPASPSEDR